MNPMHLDTDPWLSRPATELAHALEQREVSSEELVQRALDRAERLNPRVQAFVRVLPRQALEAARRADTQRRRGGARGFFCGVPTAVKDLNFMRGAFASMGTPQYRYLPSPIDDVFVKAMRRAGFVFVGKTATSELGIMPVTETLLGPPTRNPYDESRTAGGSSGGAGAAVAAGLLPLAHASDGAGSIRIPAAFCNLFGLKASARLLPNPYGRNDPHDMTANGAVTLTLRDTAAFLDVILGRWPGTAGSFLERCEHAPPHVRVGVGLVPPIGEADPRVVAITERVARSLEALGHHVEAGPATRGTLEEFLPVYQRIAAKAPLLTERSIQPVTRWLRGAGRLISDADAQRAFDGMRARVEQALGSADVVLTPTVPVLPPRVGAFDDADGQAAFARAAVLGAFTSLGNVTGRPALTVPAGFVDGLPVGVMLMGRHGADELLLQLGRQLEAAGALRVKTAG